MASAPVKRRLRIVAVAALAAFIGLLLASGFTFGSADRYLALGVAWLSVALALMLEPSSRSLPRTLLAAAGGALGGGLLTLWVLAEVEQSWYSASEAPTSLGARLGFVWSPGDAARIALVLALAALPAPLTALLVRRAGRQLEWQAAATALGPVFVGLSLFPGEILDLGPLVLLLLSGLPFGLAFYLLDRRLLGPAAVACFPGPVPTPPTPTEPTPTEPTPTEPPPTEPTPTEPPPTEPPPTTAPARGSVPRPVVLLLGSLVLASAWAFVMGYVGVALTPSGPFPGMPELTGTFEQVAALQEEHRARTGSYARTLGALEALPLDVRGGATLGYVLRYARSGDSRWILTADPVPARPGWPSLRLIGPGGELEHGRGPFHLQAETP